MPPVETVPAVVGCPVHQSAFEWPWEDWFTDPEMDPSLWPEDPGMIPGELPEDVAPEDGEMPVEPGEPEDIGDWWSNILGG